MSREEDFLKDPANYEIYSPESSDGKADWPTKIVAAIFVIVAVGLAMWGVGIVAQRFGAAPWWNSF